MFNSYVVMAGHDMVAEASRATRCRCKFKAHHYKHKVQKTNDLSKTWVLTGKQFEDFTRKKNISRLDQTIPWKTRPLN